MISLISAIGQNREIGKSGALPWHLPKDFAYFKNHTTESVMIMGRKTFEAIGKPLPRRKSIVITSQDDWMHDDVIVAKNFEDAVSKAKEFLNENPDFKKEIFVIGGGEVYRQALEHADNIYLTEVNAVFPYADTFFPEWDKNIFKESSRIHNEKDEDHDFEFDFVVYKKHS